MSSVDPTTSTTGGSTRTRTRPVVDAQIHIWHNEDVEHPWQPEWRTYAHRGGISPSVQELIAEMDAAGVDRAILVPPSFSGDDNTASFAAAERYPDRFAVMARPPMPELDTDFHRWREQPGTLGVRVTFNREFSIKWLEDGTAERLWSALEDADLPVMAFAPTRVLNLIPGLEKHPNLRLIIDHAGLPTHKPPISVERLVDEAIGLARFSNVAVKASAFPCALDEAYPFPTAQRLTRRLVDAFGPERVFWGTDLTRLPCSYSEGVRYLSEAGGLTEEELDLVMGQGLLNWLGWPGER